MMVMMIIVHVNETQEGDHTAICAGDMKMLPVAYVSGLLPGICFIMAAVILARSV
jgi:hypothetical protein